MDKEIQDRLYVLASSPGVGGDIKSVLIELEQLEDELDAYKNAYAFICEENSVPDFKADMLLEAKKSDIKSYKEQEMEFLHSSNQA